MEEDWAGQEEAEQEEDQGDYGEEEDILDIGEDVETNDRDALLMRFCPHDSSMLYPQVSLKCDVVYTQGFAFCFI